MVSSPFPKTWYLPLSLADTREKFFLAPSELLVASGIPWLMAAQLRSLPLPSCGCLPCVYPSVLSSSCKDTTSHWFRAITLSRLLFYLGLALIQHDLILTKNICNDSISKQSQVRVLRFWVEMNFGRTLFSSKECIMALGDKPLGTMSSLMHKCCWVQRGLYITTDPSWLLTWFILVCCCKQDIFSPKTAHLPISLLLLLTTCECGCFKWF